MNQQRRRSRTSVTERGESFLRKIRFESYSKAFAEKTASLFYAALKDSRPTSTTDNPKISWNPARSAWPAIRNVRLTAAEKMGATRMVENSDLPLRLTLEHLGIPRSTFMRWYKAYREYGSDGLRPKKLPRCHWNRIHERVVEIALADTEMSPREIACRMTDREGHFISESSVYRILKAHELITSPACILLEAGATAPNQLWQTDFTYLHVVGWGGQYLSTILDDYLSKELAGYLKVAEMRHTRGRPYDPHTPGKIEPWHRSMNNRIKLENYYAPGELERAIGRFVHYCNERRYHEALGNVTPSDMYEGRQCEIWQRREKLRRRTMKQRRLENLQTAA